MSYRKPSGLFSILAFSAALFSAGAVNAAVLQLDFDVSFGDPLDPDTQQPEGPAPWMTAVFDDGDTTGSVTLTVSLASTIGIAEVTGIYLNVDDVNIGGANLTINQTGGTGPLGSVSTGTDFVKAGADGWFDIYIDLPPPGGDRFGAGETLVFDITASGLVASSFDFASTPDPIDPNGPFKGAAKFNSTGDGVNNCVFNPDTGKGGLGTCSDWVGVAVPVPAAVWLFGSALGLLGWARRRTA